MVEKIPVGKIVMTTLFRQATCHVPKTGVFGLFDEKAFGCRENPEMEAKKISAKKGVSTSET